MNFLIISRCVFISLNIILVNAVRLDQIQVKCQQECGQSLLTQAEDIYDAHCNDTCRILQCGVGCQQWQEAVDKDDCRSICSKQNDSKIIPIQNLYCVVGCRLAAGLYVQTVKEEVGQPLAPVLVADSQTNISVRVRWDPAPASIVPLPVSYKIQWKYDSMPCGWEYYKRGVGATSNNVQQMDDLKPYTKYRFRVAWLILPQHEPIFSSESVVITTLPSGVPSSAPVITSVVHIDASHLSIAWNPPLFPNGPIASYVIYLRQMPTGFTVIKEIPYPSENSFMFNNLKPDSSYTLAVSCRNSIGEGPKETKNISTPSNPPTNSDHTEPYLILGAKQKVVQQSLEIFELKEPKVLYKTNDNISIKGVAIHISKKLIFVSDSLGNIIRLTSGLSSVYNITPKSMSSRPSILSVDWLNDLLYVVEDKRISRLDFDGKNYQVVVTGLEAQPKDLKVDPYNGYLYWIVHGAFKGGIYQVDLGKIVEEQPLTTDDANLIISDRHLTSFAVDYRYFRLFFPNETLNTMCSSSLSGSELIDIRNNTQQPKFQGIKSLTYHKEIFYWTNGEEVIAEEYLPVKNRYYHNSFVDVSAEKPFVVLNLLHPDAQPIPVPVNSVKNLQAVFLDTVGRITWSAPKPLSGIGTGAWQFWDYEIQVQEGVNNVTRTHRLTKTVSSVIEYNLFNLSHSTNYTIQVRATSGGGNGPWSFSFKGRTLSSFQNSPPHVLWSSSAGLIQSDLIGDNVKVIMGEVELNERKLNIVDVAWYKSKIFINSNNSEIFSFDVNQSQGLLKRMKEINSAHSLAVDWLGMKLYWSCPKQQTISRCNFDGSQVEPLLIMTIAKELNIDSINGYIYWTTSHSVECARLNGADRRSYFQTGFFSGKNVMGLALDIAGGRVYWIVWGFDRAKLYQAPTASYRSFTYSSGTPLILPDEFAQLQEDNMRGPLRFFSQRLFWVHNESVALVVGTEGNNVVQLKVSSPSPIDLRAMTVVDRSLQAAPSNLNVIPDPVDWTSVKILGQWNNFNFSWQPVTNVNYGNVFYEVGVDDQNVTNNMITEYSHYVNPSLSSIKPYSEITIAIRAFTYWATSKRIIKMLRTPMSVPSEPLNVRIFVTSIQPDVVVEIRWEMPLRPNGVILGYVVTTWATDNDNQKLSYPLTEDNVEKLSHKIKIFAANKLYFVQVLAYTEIGLGAPSPSIQVSTSNVNTIPQLLISKSSSICALDFDNHNETLLIDDIPRPTDISFLWSTNSFYWLDNTGALMSSSMNGVNKSELLQLDSRNKASSVRVDWLAHRVYWSTYNSIYRLDLVTKGKQQLLITSKKPIGTLAIDPWTSTLMWTEMDWNGKGQVMASDMDGNNIRQLFHNHQEVQIKNDVLMRTKRSYCDCPEDIQVVNALSLTFNQVFFIEKEAKILWSSDLDGCKCRILLNSSTAGSSLTSLSSIILTSDKERVFWSDSSSIYSVVRKPADAPAQVEILHYKLTGGMTAFGKDLQPTPPLNCLYPYLAHNQLKEIQLLHVTASSMVIQIGLLESSNVEGSCGIYPRLSKPSTLYVVNYVPVYELLTNDESGSNEDQQSAITKQMTTFNPTVQLENLTAYTKYELSVSLTNIYMSSHIEAATIQFQTLEGAPEKPRNVTVVVLSPEQAVVTWERPSVIRGPYVKYVIHTMGKMLKHSFNSFDGASDPLQQHFRYVISGLQADHNYSITVEAFGSTTNISNNSDVVYFITFPLPPNFTFINSSATYILLEWIAPRSGGFIKRHTIAYKELGVGQISELKWQPTTKGEKYLFNITNLLPNTRYIFRLMLEYTLNGDQDANDTYVYPKDNRFMFATKGDRPGRPGPPDVRCVGRNQYLVSWRPSAPNGGKTLHYVLEAKLNSAELNNSQWFSIYNGSETQWEVTGLDAELYYNFRIYSFNEFGISDYGDESRSVRLDQLPSLEVNNMNIILAFIVPITLIIIICGFCILYRVAQRENRKKKKERSPAEVINIGVMPRPSGNSVHMNNVLYTIGNESEVVELSGVPRISRNQIELIKLLGSGAFGEVFKGLAKNLHNDNQTVPVAIKMLKKGATDIEKAEFLKEAQLMNNFKHDHILRLLGVCLDNDPNFLIMELMEGGDLLSYLRSNRATSFTPSLLSIQDLLSICVDVAKGCCYLEELHFVHRDLAARNCLVSSHDSVERVVKIGDFGLARDVYKNDYYRKEGEGLLPVRWMSPESLVDGVFTSQSDVWAFGVLLWEVMTLGQQPYPARTNVEVLQFVRDRGRLDKPDNCPDELYQLMINCWSYEKIYRPSFKYCLNHLQELKRNFPRPMCTVHNQGYNSSPNFPGNRGASRNVNELNAGGNTNFGFNGNVSLPDEVVLTSPGGHKISNVSQKRKEENDEEDVEAENSELWMNKLFDGEQSFPSNQHKYLELLYDSDSAPLSPTDSNYEVPLVKVQHAPVTLTPTCGYSHLVDSWSVNDIGCGKKERGVTDDSKRVKYIGVSQPLLWTPKEKVDDNRRCSYENVGVNKPMNNVIVSANNTHLNHMMRNSSVSLESEDTSGCSSGPTTPNRESGLSTSSTSGIDIDCAVKVDDWP